MKPRHAARLVFILSFFLSAMGAGQNPPDVVKLGLKRDDFAKDLVETVRKEAPGSKILIVVLVDRSQALRAGISDIIVRLIPNMMNKLPAAEFARVEWALVAYADGPASCILQPTSSPDEMLQALKKIEPREATPFGVSQALNYVRLVAKQPVAKGQKTYFVLFTEDERSCDESALQTLVGDLRGAKAVLYVVGVKGEAATAETTKTPRSPRTEK